MSANSARKVYSRSGYSAFVANSKAAERGTAPLRSFVTETNLKTGESSVVDSFSGEMAELEAVDAVRRLAAEREARMIAKRNPIKAFLNNIKQKKAVLAKQKAEEDEKAARLKARMESEWNENE